MIESVNNEKIKEYSKLKNKKYRDEYNLFIVEGEHLVEEARKLNIIKEIYSLDKRENSTQVSVEVMKKLSDLTSPPKVLAICKKLDTDKIIGNVLILDNLQDPGNLGTIIRSCVAFNINTLILSNNTVDIYNSKVIRASEGMIFHINIIKGDLKEIISNMKNYTIYTTNVVNGSNLNEINLSRPYAIIMGNEGAGVRDDISSLADKSIYIPMNKTCESLNVSIATSIILYEFNIK